ncbi:hypothetical protein [Waddlia chondrophila]|uniref:hypothetical protein n=1 Tax=Waddlia chondrophila TaxID=71667 RepID=UPI0002D6CB66|nr:hypothetical protein [Waddlia chondrophila]
MSYEQLGSLAFDAVSIAAPVARAKGAKAVADAKAASVAEKVEKAAKSTPVVNKFNKVDAVIHETMSNKGNIASRFRLSVDEALDAGQKFLGSGYREMGQSGSGVFRSANGLRQFRMDKSSLLGSHNPYLPHVHFETFKFSTDKRFYTNNHVPFYD